MKFKRTNTCESMDHQNPTALRHVPPHIARAIAVAAQCDPRTVQRVLGGLPTKAIVRDRILRAMDRANPTRTAVWP
jgi:hypothetical protein